MFLACEKKAETGVAEVHWDRDMCSRCVMVVSDRKKHCTSKKSRYIKDIYV